MEIFLGFREPRGFVGHKLRLCLPPGWDPAKDCSLQPGLCATSGHSEIHPLPFRNFAGYPAQMPILFLLPIAVIAALLAGWDRQGLPRFLLLTFGIFAAAVWLWVAIAFLAVNRPL